MDDISKAIESGDVKSVNEAIEGSTTFVRFCPRFLQLALDKRNSEVIKLILNKVMTIKYFDPERVLGLAPLHVACLKNDRIEVQKLFR